MDATKRKTDHNSEDHDHTCERDYCEHHEIHKQNIADLWKESNKKVAWIVFSCILAILLVAIGGSYKYTQDTNAALRAELVVANDKQDALTANFRADMKEDLKDIKTMLQSMAEKNRR